MNRSRTAVLVVALVAFLVGLVAPATGASITKGTVKKIAAKVVTKAAPKLSVAHAADATTLQGRSVAELQTAGVTYTLTPSAGFGLVGYRFTGLPAGTYLVTYDVSLGFSTAPSGASCYLALDGSSVQLAYAEARVGGTYGNCVGSGVVTAGPGLAFHASGSTPAQVYSNPNYPSTVTFVRLDAVTSRAEQPLP